MYAALPIKLITTNLNIMAEQPNKNKTTIPPKGNDVSHVVVKSFICPSCKTKTVVRQNNAIHCKNYWCGYRLAD